MFKVGSHDDPVIALGLAVLDDPFLHQSYQFNYRNRGGDIAPYGKGVAPYGWRGG